MNSDPLPVSSYQLPRDFVVAGVNLNFSYAAGEAASRFLTALRDEQRIYGTRCPACARVLVPARSFCPRCFVDTTDWIEVGPMGTLVAIASAPPPPRSPAPPLPIGLIRLDGADTNFVHLLGETSIERVTPGMRVEAVFAQERSGSILDIAYFRSIEETA